MPQFSKASKEKLATCHCDLQKLFNEVIKVADCTIIEGHRGKEAQNKAYAEGKSQLKWPQGRHNKIPSEAVDVVPYPIDWNDIERFKKFALVVKSIAKTLGIKVTHGGDWPRFKDWPHWELA